MVRGRPTDNPSTRSGIAPLICRYSGPPCAPVPLAVTSEPAKIDAALNASLRVLRGLRTSSITPRELARAKRTLTSRHEADLKDNGYWLALMTHLQCDSVPLKTPQCLR